MRFVGGIVDSSRHAVLQPSKLGRGRVAGKDGYSSVDGVEETVPRVKGGL